MVKPKLSRLAQALKDLRALKAQDIGTLSKAHADAQRLGKDRFLASGVIVSVTTIGGTTLLEPVMIADGLSDETIKALRRDIKATYDYRLTMNRIRDDG